MDPKHIFKAETVHGELEKAHKWTPNEKVHCESKPKFFGPDTAHNNAATAHTEPKTAGNESKPEVVGPKRHSVIPNLHMLNQNPKQDY